MSRWKQKVRARARGGGKYPAQPTSPLLVGRPAGAENPRSSAAKLIGRIDADPAVSFGNFQRLQYFQIAPLPAQFANAGGFSICMKGSAEPSRMGTSMEVNAI